jgi:hypothetical protein
LNLGEDLLDTLATGPSLKPKQLETSPHGVGEPRALLEPRDQRAAASRERRLREKPRVDGIQKDAIADQEIDDSFLLR